MRFNSILTTGWLLGTAILASGCAGRMVNQCARPFGDAPTPRSESTLTVLSYNVKGLPAIAGGGDNERRYSAIARTLDAYDVVAVQELFHRRMLLANDLSPEFAVSLGGRGSWGGLRRYGSGLALAARRGDAIPALSMEHVFRDCAGRITGASDCWSRKGVLGGGMRLPNGDTLHVYSLHLDAGNRPEDRAVRVRQLVEVAQFIEQRSHDKPVLVMGDFNVERTDATDHATLARFAQRLELRDAGALDRTFCVEHLDYVLYRGSARTPLRLTSAGVDARAFGDGPSSDHPPIYAVFSY